MQTSFSMSDMEEYNADILRSLKLNACTVFGLSL